MKYDDYLVQSSITDIKDYGPVIDRMGDTQMAKIIHAILGLGTEIGELQDSLKRFLIYGKRMDPVNILEEHGDLFWYAALLARACGYTFEEAMAKNIAKLKARYPDGFTEHAALNRNLDAEREALGDNGGYFELPKEDDEV